MRDVPTPDPGGRPEPDPDRATTDRTTDRPSREPGEISPWALAGLGVQLAVSLWLFITAGQWLDRRFDSAPVFLLSGVFLGAGGTFVLSLRRLLAPRSRRSPDRRTSP